MVGIKVDNKNIKLIKLLAQLRDHVDVYRVLTLNVEKWRASDFSDVFANYLARTTHESLAIYICKIYEVSPRNDLNSIPGIIASLDDQPIGNDAKEVLEEFGRKFGINAEPEDLRSYLEGAFGLFSGLHRHSLDRLKKYRDKIGAHSDAKADIDSLPSHAEFEQLFDFAIEFNRVVSICVSGSHPPQLMKSAGRGLIRLMEMSGATGLAFDFENEE